MRKVGWALGRPAYGRRKWTEVHRPSRTANGVSPPSASRSRYSPAAKRYLKRPRESVTSVRSRSPATVPTVSRAQRARRSPRPAPASSSFRPPLNAMQSRLPLLRTRLDADGPSTRPLAEMFPSRCDNPRMNTAINVLLARRGFESVVNGDFDALGELLDSDVKWHGGDPSAPGACHTRLQALEFIRRARDNGQLGELVDVIGVGNKVVVTMRAGQEHAETHIVANLATFTNGKVTEMVHYPNPNDALTAAHTST
jgi:ketosteroid isomerase-like protein